MVSDSARICIMFRKLSSAISKALAQVFIYYYFPYCIKVKKIDFVCTLLLSLPLEIKYLGSSLEMNYTLL